MDPQEREAQMEECRQEIARMQRYIDKAHAGGYARDEAKFQEKQDTWKLRLEELMRHGD